MHTFDLPFAGMIKILADFENVLGDFFNATSGDFF
mgnify:FL=1